MYIMKWCSILLENSFYQSNNGKFIQEILEVTKERPYLFIYQRSYLFITKKPTPYIKPESYLETYFHSNVVILLATISVVFSIQNFVYSKDEFVGVGPVKFPIFYRFIQKNITNIIDFPFSAVVF